MALSPARKPNQPYAAATFQEWTGQQVQAQQQEALYGFGELCLFTLMWNYWDFDAGLVEHCTTCFYGDQNRQTKAFQQPARVECPDCYGTTYEGGYRAQVIRPALISDRNTETVTESRGETPSSTLSLETTGDFTMNTGDYVFRYDNTRFQSDAKSEAVIRTGFSPPRGPEGISGQVTAHLESTNGPAYLIPPDASELASQLGVSGPFLVSDITALDVVRENGYII